MYQCQHCGNPIHNREIQCPHCGMVHPQTPYTMPQSSPIAATPQSPPPGDKSTECKHVLAAKMDTYGSMWQVIGMLQMILIVILAVGSLPTLFALNKSMSPFLSFAENPIAQQIFMVIALTLIILVIGFANWHAGKAISKSSELALHNPLLLMDKFFVLKSLIKTFVCNLLVSGCLGTGIDVNSAIISIGMMGIIGSLYSFHVRYYILSHKYALSPSAQSCQESPAHMGSMTQRNYRR